METKRMMKLNLTAVAAASFLACCLVALPPAASAQEGPEQEDIAPPPPAGDASLGEAGWRGKRDGRERRKLRGEWDRQGRGRGGEGGRNHMAKFLGMVKNYEQAVGEPGGAVSLSLLSIKQHYKRAGRPAEAAAMFEELLKKITDRKMRNIVLFSIRQVYEEQRDAEKVLAVNKRILEENLGLANGSLAK